MYKVGDKVEFIDWRDHARRANAADGILDADIPMEDVITRAVVIEVMGDPGRNGYYKIATEDGEILRKRDYALFNVGEAVTKVNKYGRAL
jgi:hypothetical protein